jgi:hypothetical protein
VITGITGRVLTLENGPTGCPEKSVNNYQTTLRNVPEQGSCNSNMAARTFFFPGTCQVHFPHLFLNKTTVAQLLGTFPAVYEKNVYYYVLPQQTLRQDFDCGSVFQTFFKWGPLLLVRMFYGPPYF